MTGGFKPFGVILHDRKRPVMIETANLVTPTDKRQDDPGEGIVYIIYK